MRTIALLSEKSREYGRELLKGVAAYAQTRGDWRMHSLKPSDLLGRDPLAEFDGVIARAADSATWRRLRKSGLPIVDAFSQRPSECAACVDCDHAAIAAIAAKYFLKHGYRNFAYCGFRGTRFSDDRRDVFRRLVTRKENGSRRPGVRFFEYMVREMPNDAIFFDERTRPEEPSSALREWLGSLPDQTAIFCANDYRAYNLLELARELGRRIPDELAVMGVDDDTILCAFSSPSLSSINPNAYGVGFAAARILNAMMDEREEEKLHPVFRVRPKGIIERTSSRHYPIDPPWMSNVLDRIHRDYSNTPTTTDLVAVAGRSHPVVEKAFRSNFGMTIGKYVMASRMEEATRLLAEGCPSGEVGRLTGFSTPQYFTECYRQHFGHAPTKTEMEKSDL